MQLLKRYHKVIQEETQQGTGTGVARRACWTSNGSNPGYMPSTNNVSAMATGNSLNTAISSAGTAKKVCDYMRFTVSAVSSSLHKVLTQRINT